MHYLLFFLYLSGYDLCNCVSGQNLVRLNSLLHVSNGILGTTLLWLSIDNVLQQLMEYIFHSFLVNFQIVNGPEVLSKFVGETEKNIRDLFADAENDQRTRGKGKKLPGLLLDLSLNQKLILIIPFYVSGDQSDLHVIIFDEIDAICKVSDFGNSI